MTIHMYALFEDENDYKDAYVEAEEKGLINESENLQTLRSVEDEDDIPFAGTSMRAETFAYTFGGLLLGALIGNTLGRLPTFTDIPTGTLMLLSTPGLGVFGFLAGIFIGASRTESQRQHMWRSFRPGNLAVLLDVRSKTAAERLADVFSRHNARMVARV
jgi:hypothetical protein